MFDTSQTSTKILLALVAVVLLFIPGRFAYSQYQDVQSQVNSLNVSANLLDAQAAEAEEVRSDREGYDAQLAALETAIPQEIELTNIIDQLTDAAIQSGVVLSSGAPAEDSESGAYAITLTVSGGAGNVASFLDALRELPRLVTVQQVSTGVDSTTIRANFYAQS